MTDSTLAEQNKALVAQFVADIWNAKQFDKLQNYVAAEYVQHNPNLPNGRAALEEFLKVHYLQNMPTGDFSIARLVAEGDLVVAHSLFRLNPTDRGTAVVDIYRISNDRLVEHWDVREPVPEDSASGNPVV